MHVLPSPHGLGLYHESLDSRLEGGFYRFTNIFRAGDGTSSYYRTCGNFSSGQGGSIFTEELSSTSDIAVKSLFNIDTFIYEETN